MPKNHPENGDNFFLKVYEVVKQVPEGRVTTYGAIARFIGAPGASRMVGWAMNGSHTFDPSIPAHRVVNRNGLLTGKSHFRHPGLMQQMLECEGIKVDNDQIINFAKFFWDPCSELI
ncbi:MAG: MGMT family protein [Bacteroidales bacterium]|nr:MGMT family protein [Bacteroidales bacterium]